ncbi:MAG: PHP domain-containing protein, partial [Bacteroidales bacterium]
MVKRAIEINCKALGIMDNNLAGVPKFIKACKSLMCKCGKELSQCGGNNSNKNFFCEPVSVKPIIGMKVNITEDYENDIGKICLIAKNFDGWKDLIIVNNESNNYALKTHKLPMISVDKISSIISKNNLICVVGGIDSTVSRKIFGEKYHFNSYEEAKSFVRDWKSVIDTIGKYKDIFSDVFLETGDGSFASQILTKIWNWVSSKINVKLIASSPSYYSSPQDSYNHRLFLSIGLKTNLSSLANKILSERPELVPFLKHNHFYIRSSEEMINLFGEDKVQNTSLLSEMVSDFDIFSKPKLPNFLDSYTEDSIFLKKISYEALNSFLRRKNIEHLRNTYEERLKKELEVFEEARLSSYFLIVRDFCQYAKSSGWLMSPGRGSVGGSLVAMLIGITDESIDPIANELIFERFYNRGRNTDNRVHQDAV